MPILKHRLELQGISHVVSLVSFSDVKAFEENNVTGFTPKRRLNHYGVESVPKITGFRGPPAFRLSPTFSRPHGFRVLDIPHVNA